MIVFGLTNKAESGEMDRNRSRASLHLLAVAVQIIIMVLRARCFPGLTNPLASRAASISGPNAFAHALTRQRADHAAISALSCILSFESAIT